MRDAKCNSPREKQQRGPSVDRNRWGLQYAYWPRLQTVGDPAKITNEARGFWRRSIQIAIQRVMTISEQVDHRMDNEMLISQLPTSSRCSL